MTGRPLSGMSACLILARLTVKRTLRSRGLKLSAVMCLVPILFAVFLVEEHEKGLRGWRQIYVMALGLLALIPPLHLAPTIAEEVEDKTFTYLWSRPLARWTVIGGKLIALLPMLSLLLGVSVAVSYQFATGDAAGSMHARQWHGVLGMVVGTVAVGLASVGIGSLLPKHALASAATYVLIFDMPIGALPFELRNISITYQARHIAQVTGDPGGIATATVWALAIGLAWLAVGMWRITVAEYATDK